MKRTESYDINNSVESNNIQDQLEDKMNFMDQLMVVKNNMKNLYTEIKKFKDGDEENDEFD